MGWIKASIYETCHVALRTRSRFVRTFYLSQMDARRRWHDALATAIRAHSVASYLVGIPSLILMLAKSKDLDWLILLGAFVVTPLLPFFFPLGLVGYFVSSRGARFE